MRCLTLFLFDLFSELPVEPAKIVLQEQASVHPASMGDTQSGLQLNSDGTHPACVTPVMPVVAEPSVPVAEVKTEVSAEPAVIKSPEITITVAVPTDPETPKSTLPTLSILSTRSMSAPLTLVPNAAVAPPAPSRAELIMLVGCPASGKTTWAMANLIPKGYQHVEPDTFPTPELRLKATQAVSKH